MLDQLNYVHHPKAYGVYLPREQRKEQFDVTIDDPALYRKPYEALSRDEKIEGIKGIKAVLSTRGVAMPVNRIHGEVFGGNGSTQHIRDLVNTVAEEDGATYKPTAGGTKVLRVNQDGYVPEPSPDSEPEPEEQADAEPDQQDDDKADKDGLRNKATEEMDALMNAQAVTDGGQDKDSVE